MKTLSMYVNKKNAVQVWTAVKPWLVMAAELAFLAVLWTLYQLCRGVSWLGRQAHEAIATTDFRRVARDTFRALKLREVWELLLFGTPILLLIGCVAALLSVLALAGLGAGRVVAWFDDGEFDGAA